MTVVVYKDFKIELEQDGKFVDYSIWDIDGFLIANDYVELPLKAVRRDCELLVDEYLDDPRAFI